MLWYGGVVKQLAQIRALGLHADRDGMVLQGPIRPGEIVVWFFWIEEELAPGAAEVVDPALVREHVVHEDVIDAWKKRHVGGHICSLVRWGLVQLLQYLL